MNTRFTTQQIVIGKQSFRLRLFVDMNREFDQHFAENQQDPEPPLYGSLWPAALGLAHYLWQERERLRALRILEIGCGLGLPSLVCAHAGARVTALDHHAGALPLISLNTQLNGMQPIRFLVGSFTDPLLDLGRYDLIIGSDILYEPEHYPRLEDFIHRHAKPQSRVILADPGRYAADKFGTLLKQCGPSQLHQQIIPNHSLPIDIHQFKLERPAPAKAKASKLRSA